MVYIPKGNYPPNLVYGEQKNALASEGPNGDPIATSPIYLYNIVLNIKYDSLVSKDRRSFSLLFFKFEQCRCF